MRINWSVILVGVLAIAVLVQQWQLQGLRADLKNALVNKELLDRALKERATAEQPVVVNVTPAGATAPVPVRVFIDRGESRPTAPSSGPSGPPPRLVAEAPPIFCKSKEECDHLYARAPQTITADAQIRQGTLVAVCLVPLQSGLCPDDKRADLPLAVPLKFTAQFVLADRGVFTGLNVEGAPLVITQVRTETQIVERQIGPELPYHLGLTPLAVLGGQVFSGVEYQNRAYSGIYRLQVGYGYPGLTGGVSWTIPIR